MSNKIISPIVKFILSHHPDCPGFEGDTILIFKYNVCLGCFVLYPTIALILMSNLVFRWDIYFIDIILHKDLLLIMAAIFFLPQFIKYFKNTREKSYNIIIKIMLSLSISLMIIWAFTLSLSIYLKVIIILFFFIIGSLSGIFRFLYIQKVCTACKYRANWDICYGFRGLNGYYRSPGIKCDR